MKVELKSRCDKVMDQLCAKFSYMTRNNIRARDVFGIPLYYILHIRTCADVRAYIYVCIYVCCVWHMCVLCVHQFFPI